MKSKESIILVLSLLIIVVSAIFFQVVVNSPERVEKILLKEHNLHDVKVGGYNWWWCTEGTTIRRNFEAKNNKNEAVKGSICAGRLFLKDSVTLEKIKS